MKRFRQLRVSAATVAVAVAILVTTIGPPPARSAGTVLAQQFAANMRGDVTTAGAALPTCAASADCPESAAAALQLPPDSRVVYARLLWAAGLGEDCRAASVPVRLRLGVTGTDGNTGWTTIGGTATGEHTAEAEVTEVLAGARPPVSVTVARLRDDACAAGWSLAIAYTAPEAEAGTAGLRHVAILSGAAGSGPTIDGFRRHGAAAPRLTATVYGGDAEPTVNGTALDGAEESHVIDTAVPSGAIRAGGTSAEIGFGDGLLVQQVALSVPVAAIGVAATAAPTEIGPGSTVRHTITVTNNAGIPATPRLRVDLRRALDDASSPVGIAASNGQARFTGSRLTWRGELAAGATATVSYSVTVKNPRPGDGRLESTVTAGPDSNCPAGDPGPACVVELRFPPRPHTDDAGVPGAPGARLPVTGPALAAPAGLGLAALGLGAALLLAGHAARRPARRRATA